ADRALAHGPRQGAVDPLGLAAAQKEPADEVRGRQIVVAGDRDERAVEVVGHGLDEARLPAARGALEHDRQALPERRLEHPLFVSDGDVMRSRPASRARHSIDGGRSSTAGRHYRLAIRRRGTSAERRAARNSGPITCASCSVLGAVACAALPKTRRSVSGSVPAPTVKQTHPVPRRRASASARRASAAPYASSYPWS